MKPMLALYVGGMGARGKNFYNDLACRYGYEAAAKEIQDLYLDGKKAEATAAVPDELVDEIALLGPRERIADRLEAWKSSGHHHARRGCRPARGPAAHGRARALTTRPFAHRRRLTVEGAGVRAPRRSGGRGPSRRRDRRTPASQRCARAG